MTETFALNIYPLFKFFIIVLAIFGGYNLASNFFHLLQRTIKDVLDHKKDNLAKEKDSEIINNLIAKYPLVTASFIDKTTKEQNIENNQEIHEINKRFENLERLVQEVIKKCK